jgi:hypothetical protein
VTSSKFIAPWPRLAAAAITKVMMARIDFMLMNSLSWIVLCSFDFEREE